MAWLVSCSSLASTLGISAARKATSVIAPEDRRAEVVSAYFICGFLGNALPVVGIGVVSTFASPILASVVFAGMIAAFAAIALAFGLSRGER